MLKYVLLSGAMMISAPALAQDAPMQDQPADTSATAPTNTAPVEEVSQGSPQAVTPDQALPEAPNAPQDATETADEAATDAMTGDQATATADAQTTATPDQISDLVEQQFATYDAEGNGELTKEQFGEWMVALRKASEPDLEEGSTEVAGWIDQAFAQADTDNDDGVGKEEVKSFLTPAG